MASGSQYDGLLNPATLVGDGAGVRRELESIWPRWKRAKIAGRIVSGGIMKLEQLILWLIAAVVLYFIARAFFEIYDEITYETDPVTGKQKVVARKNRMLDGPEPLTLEGN